MGTKNYEIPSVPTNNINTDDQTGLRNLAGWMARYHNFGLSVFEVSPLISELLEQGILAKFEPSLKGLQGGRSAGDEEYECYEFDVCINDFVNIDGHDWANLHFSFLANKCTMYVECCNQSKEDKISPALEVLFGAIGVDTLLEEEYSREITWQEADEIILRYLRYVKNPWIPSVPE